MADRDEAVPAGTRTQRGEMIAERRARQIHPPDDAGDERMRRRGREELARLVEARARLDEDAQLDSGGAQERREIRRAERAANRRELVGEPRVVGRGGIPEMMVRVDGRHPFPAPAVGTGAPGAISRSARSSAHKASGIGSRSSRG